MRILHITEKPRFSGAEILIRDLALSHLPKADIAIGAFNPTAKNFEKTLQQLKEKGVQLFVPDNSLSKPSRIKYLVRLFKNYQPDVVVGHSPVVNAYIRIAGAMFPKVKKVIVLHSASGDYEQGDKLQWMEHILQYFTAYVIGVAEWSRDAYQRRYHHAKCKTIHNGIDLAQFTAENREYRDRLRKETFEASEEDFVILQVGRISGMKNQLMTLQAVSALPEKIRLKTKVIFAGIAEERDYYDNLKSYITENNLDKNVKFLDARSDVNKLIYAADLFVMPSETENFSIAILEALATGIPTIYSNITPFRFLSKYEYQNIFEFNLNSIAEYSRKIQSVIEKKIGFCSRDLSDFSLEKTAQKYLELFENIVDGK